MIDARLLRPGMTAYIAYLSNGDYTERRISVDRTFVGQDGCTIIVGFCHLRGAQRAFRADRVCTARSCPLPRQATFSQAAVAAWWQGYLTSDAVHERLAFA